MKTRSSDDPLVPTWALRTVLAGSALVLIGAATPPGAAVAGDVQLFLTYYAGVFTLLAVTVAVMSGLLATDRLVLGIRHRVLAQSVHRAASVLAVTSLVTHFMVKVLSGLAGPAQVVVPGLTPVGLGALALDLMIVIVATGTLRARFALGDRPWVWRSVHAVAYLSWPAAIVHGLTAGRVAPLWVTLSYLLSVVAVALALLTRMFAGTRPRDVRRAGDGLAPPGERTAERAAAQARAADRAAARARRGEAVR